MARLTSSLITAAPEGLIVKCTSRPAATSTSSSLRAYTAPLAPVIARTSGRSELSLLADIERRNSKRQRPIFYVLEPDAAHPLGQRFAVGKLRDRCWKIFVSGRMVAGKELADPWQNVAEVEQVE